MRALTVKQPWASAIALGLKAVENRGRPYPWLRAINEPLYLHAGLGWDSDATADLRIQEAVGEGLLDLEVASSLRGVLLATLCIISVDNCEGVCDMWANPGVWHLHVAKVEALPTPIASRGMLGLWTLA